VDGEVVLDNTSVPLGGSFFGVGRGEITGTLALEAGRSYAVEVRMRRGETNQTMAGLHLGALAPTVGDLVDDAVDVAGTADVAIVIVGTNAEWESEGWDRDDLSLPGRQDELVARVADACPRTIVVVNAGSPVAMPWLDEVDAVVCTWFPGQEMGDALADVLLGEVEPEGRLPVTFPRRMEDTPASEHHPGRNGVAHYDERRLMGYRWYDTIGREPVFPFGFGLGYAATQVVGARLVGDHLVEVQVANSSHRDGVEVVQVYAHRVDRTGLAADEPEQRLVGFAKVPVPAGVTVTAQVALDARAYSSWSLSAGAWVDDASPFELRVGRSSRDVSVRLARG
jgi:beta-glucosidase